jgi:hypothetical protein
MASRLNSWSQVKTLIYLEMWSEESSESKLDVVNSSIYRGCCYPFLEPHINKKKLEKIRKKRENTKKLKEVLQDHFKNKSVRKIYQNA